MMGFDFILTCHRNLCYYSTWYMNYSIHYTKQFFGSITVVSILSFFFANLAILAKDLHLDLVYFRVIVSALKFFIFSYVSLFSFYCAKK